MSRGIVGDGAISSPDDRTSREWHSKLRDLARGLMTMTAGYHECEPIDARGGHLSAPSPTLPD
jgi:hypothetical protein